MKDSESSSFQPQVSKRRRQTVHLRDEDIEYHGQYQAWCGVNGKRFHFTTDGSRITCRRCLHALLNSTYEYIGPNRTPR